MSCTQPRWFAAFVAAALLTACTKTTPPDTGSRGSVAPDPGVLVILHSWTGRTAIIGEEIAAMLGGRIVRVGGSPFAPPGDASIAGQLRSAVGTLQGVRDVYLGFPIWGNAPSAVIQQVVAHLDLKGIRVVPFYTFMHYVSPEALAALSTALRARGADVAPAIGFRIRMNASTEEVVAAARRAVLDRPELWADGAPADRAVGCSDGRCAIPAGKVWIGDTGPAAPPGAAPPRLRSVAAFAIDEGEVTVRSYARCVAAGKCPAIDMSINGFCEELVRAGDAVPLPCASLAEAAAYCRWAGGRLPAEAEWTRAARGATTHLFPWGDELELSGQPLRGNFGEKPSTGYRDYATVPEDQSWPADGYPGLAPTCAFPAGRSPFGVCDLEGNLAEWAVPDEAAVNVTVLGGSWLDGEVAAFRLGLRYASSETLPSEIALGKVGHYLVGFRCAYPVSGTATAP